MAEVDALDSAQHSLLVDVNLAEMGNNEDCNSRSHERLWSSAALTRATVVIESLDSFIIVGQLSASVLVQNRFLGFALLVRFHDFKKDRGNNDNFRTIKFSQHCQDNMPSSEESRLSYSVAYVSIKSVISYTSPFYWFWSCCSSPLVSHRLGLHYGYSCRISFLRPPSNWTGKSAARSSCHDLDSRNVIVIVFIFKLTSSLVHAQVLYLRLGLSYEPPNWDQADMEKQVHCAFTGCHWSSSKA